MKATLALALLVALQVGPSIAADPSSGTPGTTFVVSGSGFAAGDRIRVTWDGANLGGVARADSSGAFVYSAVVPAGSAAGTHVVAAQGRTSGGTSTGFTVVIPATTTTTTTVTTTTAVTTTTVTTSAPTTAPATTAPPATAPATTVPPTTAPATSVASTPPVESVPPSQPVDAPATTTTSIAPGRERPGGGAGVGIVEILGVLIGLAAIAFAARLRWGRTPTVAAQQHPVEVAGPERETAPPVDVTHGGWARRALATEASVTGCRSVPGGILAFGSSSGSGAAVWRSTDGLAWSSLAVLDAGRVAGVAMTRDGLYAVGECDVEEGPAAACWWTGDGVTWVRRTAPRSLRGVTFESVAVAGGRLVAHGRRPEGPGVWTSIDGSDWSRIGMLDGVDLVAEASGTLFAFGPRALERDAIVARSTDGVSWEPLREALFVFHVAALSCLVAYDGGLVAAGSDKMTGAAAVWVSDDGERWLRAPLEPRPGTTIDHLVPTGGGLVAVGSDAGPRRTRRPSSIALWDSEDAVTWRRRESSDLLENAAPAGAAATGDALVVVGTLLPGLGSPWPVRTPATWAHPLDVRQGTESGVEAMVAR